MADRTYRDVDVDLDDLADAIIDWFEHDEFEVQDFQEGPAIFIQARKQSLLSRISATTQALNVRLSPLSSGFKIQVGAGEWMDKGVGALATGLAVRLAAWPLALGAGVATGFGIYQQLKLPDLLLEFVDMYVERHGVFVDEPAPDRRRGTRREPARAVEVEEELDDLRQERGTGRGRPSLYCPECGKPVKPSDNFCPSCGARVADRTVAPDDGGDARA